MTQSNENPVGDTPASGGTQDDKEHVAYSTYSKLLGEKKKRDAELEATRQRLEALEREKKEREETELKQKEDFKSLLTLREQELAAEKAKRTEIETTLSNGLKLDAFLKSVSGKIDDAYLGLVDLDKIVIDPNTGRPDDSSVKALAKEFEQRYHRVIERPTGVSLPNNAAGSGAGTLSIDEWKALPLKEMKARLKDVIKK